MINSTFTNIPATDIRRVIPQGILIPSYSKYIVSVTIPTEGDAEITVKGGADPTYLCSSTEAFETLQVLHSL